MSFRRIKTVRELKRILVVAGVVKELQLCFIFGKLRNEIAV